MRPFTPSLARSWLGVPLLLAACSLPRETGEGFPDTATRLRAAIPVSERVVSSPEIAFTSIPRLAVDSRGLIYVPEHYNNRVTVLSEDGRLIRTLGRRGSGPGEFQAVQSVQVLPGDSLLVYDPALGRASVFAPDSIRPAYTALLSAGGAAPWQVQRTRANDGYLVRYQPMFEFASGSDISTRMDRIAVLNLDGSVRQRLRSFPSRTGIVVDRSVMLNPFGREGLVQLDSRERLHFVWTDSLAVSRTDLDGNPLPGFNVPYTPPRVTSADLEDALSVLTSSVRRQFEPALADSAPGRWPAVRDMLIDDQDRIWLALAGTLRRPTEWAAFSPDGTYIRSVLIPVGSSVRFIRGDRFYAERLKDDVPHVVVYQMARPLR
jgi:hypothetical protein